MSMCGLVNVLLWVVYRCVCESIWCLGCLKPSQTAMFILSLLSDTQWARHVDLLKIKQSDENSFISINHDIFFLQTSLRYPKLYSSQFLQPFFSCRCSMLPSLLFHLNIRINVMWVLRMKISWHVCHLRLTDAF